MKRVYNDGDQWVRVDTIRKVVIIATGGKIGNRLLSNETLESSEQERIEERHPSEMSRPPRMDRTSRGRFTDEQRQIRDDFGPAVPLRRGIAPGYTRATGLWGQQGVDNS